MSVLAFSNLKQILETVIFPVGAPYINFADPRNPNEILGFGTWEPIAGGHAIVGAGGAYAALEVGGAETHTLTEAEIPDHDHTGTVNIDHDHSLDMGANGTFSDTTNNRPASSDGTGGFDHTKSGAVNTGGGNKAFTTDGAGGGGAHNNMPPYIAAYMWRRTA